MLKYDKNQVSEEEDRKFKQEEVFYNSNHLTKEVIEYAQEHINNFLKNVLNFQKERESAEYCYRNFDRKILALKNFFFNSVKNKDKTYHLGIDFSKEEEDSIKRNKTWSKNNKKEDKSNDECYDNKSNGNDVSNNNNENNKKDNKNEINDDFNKNIVVEIKENNSSKSLSGSDIYLEDKNKNRKKSRPNSRKNKNKEPSLYPKNNNKKSNKNKRKRK